MPEPITVIASFLFMSALNTASGEAIKCSAKNVWEKLTKPELHKYKNTFDPIFLSAFKKTINKFSTENASAFMLPKDILNELNSFDEIKLGIIFGNPDTTYYSSLTSKNIYKKLTEKLKEYSQSRGYYLEEQFYITWETLFEREYVEAFRFFFTNEQRTRDDIILNFFGVSTEQLSSILQTLSSNSDDIKEIKNVIFEIRDNMQKTSLPLQGLSELSEEFIQDKDIQKLQNLINEYKYADCLTYINLCLHDEWNNRSNEFKAEVYNKKGFCLQANNDNDEAIDAYKFASELNPVYEKPIANLCKIYLNNRDVKNFNKYFNKFANEETLLYKEIKFYKLLLLDRTPDIAEIYLETNKSFFDDYLYLKAKIAIVKISPYNTIINLLEEYIKQKQPKSIAAKFDLLQAKFAKLFEKHNPGYRFYINEKTEIKVVLDNIKPINNDEILSLTNSLEEILKIVLCRTPKNINHINSLKALILLSKFMQNSLVFDDPYIADVLSNIEKIENDYYINLIFVIALLTNDFESAYHIYKLMDAPTQELNIDQFVLILIGSQKYKEALSVIQKTKNKPLEGFEQLNLIAQYKTQDWTIVKNYIKHNLSSYSNDIKRLCAELMYENEEFNDALKLYKELAMFAINNSKKVNCDYVYNVSYRLKFFYTQNGIKELDNKLIETFWTENQINENFDIGILLAKDLYNKGKHAKCISILEILEKYNPNNQEIQELYANIDLINYNPENIIKYYENGYKPQYLLPHVAFAYLNTKSFKKAKDVIEKLKYYNKLSDYYYYKAHLYLLKNRSEQAITVLKEGSSKCPDDLRIHQMAFSLLLHESKKFKKPNSYHDLFNKSKNVMMDNKLLFEFKVDEKSIQSDLQNAIKSIETENYRKSRIEKYTNAINYYEENIYPVDILAFVLNKDIGTIFTDMLFNKNAIVNLFSGLITDLQKEITVLKNNKNILIDICTLILLKEIGLDKIFFKEFNLKISVYTMDLIKRIFADETLGVFSEQLIETEKGEVALVTVENQIYKFKEYLEDCINKYKVLKFNSSSKQGIHLLEANEKIGIKDLFYQGIVGLQHKTLVCTDTPMARYYEQFKVPHISIISMLEFLYQEKKISQELYTKAKFKLVDLKCRYIPLQSADLYFALINSINSFEILINSFDKFIDFKSLAVVLCNFICILNKNESTIRDKKYVALELMFNKIKLLSPDANLIKLLAIEVYKYYSSFNDLLQKYLSNKFYEEFNEDVMIFYTTLISQYKENKKDFNEHEYKTFCLRVTNNAPFKLKGKIEDFYKEEL